MNEFGPGGTSSGAAGDPLSYAPTLTAKDVKAPEGTTQANERREGAKGEIQKDSENRKVKHENQNPATSKAADVAYDPAGEAKKSVDFAASVLEAFDSVDPTMKVNAAPGDNATAFEAFDSAIDPTLKAKEPTLNAKKSK
jgi:hypothetical protein